MLSLENCPEAFQHRSELAECLCSMRDRELLYHCYNPFAQYLPLRRELVSWIIQTTDRLKLHKTTGHVAVCYLDRFLQLDDCAPRSRYTLTAMCCILLAAKYDDIETNIPSLADLNEWAGTDFNNKQIRRAELHILGKLGWGLTTVTPLHFLEYYVKTGIVFVSRDILPRFDGRTPDIYQSLTNYVTLFADLCVQDYSFKQFPPSILAASIIKVARQLLRMGPAWSIELAYLTGYRDDDFVSCYDHLWAYIRCNLHLFPMSHSQHQYTVVHQAPCYLLPADVTGPNFVQSAYGAV